MGECKEAIVNDEVKVNKQVLSWRGKYARRGWQHCAGQAGPVDASEYPRAGCCGLEYISCILFVVVVVVVLYLCFLLLISIVYIDNGVLQSSPAYLVAQVSLSRCIVLIIQCCIPDHVYISDIINECSNSWVDMCTSVLLILSHS
ncbi:unnamed protein product [Nezara viridula]|uniref:Uncharacterized protein n=1 Tax=Nezara viridula TaxID=85310 RepID=A0A9P0MVA7_NEZVI|nr:unnamed protein product [Nezara viridula]